MKNTPANLPIFIFKPQWWYAITAGAFAFLLYANTIGNDYAIDDGALITTNRYVQQGIKGLGGIFTTDVWIGEGAELGYYRPLPLATFAIEHSLFGNSPHKNHLVNALLYALSIMLLFIALTRLFPYKVPGFAFMVCLLFAAHPIHTEVVANIKSRDEILALLNMLAALYFLLLYSASAGHKYIYLLLAGILYYLALLSKETAFTGLALLPFALFISKRIEIKKLLVVFFTLAIATAVFFCQKSIFLGAQPQHDALDIVSFPYAVQANKWATALTHFTYYVKLSLIPWPLSYNYAYNQIPAAGWANAATITGILLFIFIAGVLLYSYKKAPVLALGTGIFLLGLAPAMGFVILKGGIFAERFLYLPSLGFSLIIGWLITQFLCRQSLIISKQAWFATGGIVLAYSLITIQRNKDWKDDYTLAAHDVIATPGSCQVHLHYGKKLIDMAVAETGPEQRKSYFNTGIEQLEIALAINPHYARAYFKLAYAYQVIQQNNDSAIYYYHRAIDEAPGYAPAYNNLGAIYGKTGRYNMAEYYLKKALDIDPGMTSAIQQLQMLHAVEAAPVAPAMPADTNKNSFAYYSAEGVKYAQAHDLSNAEKYLLKAVELNPKSVDARVNLAVCYGMMKEYGKSAEMLKKALELEPGNKNVLQNLATLYHLTGDKAREKECLEKLKKP
ncbi:MAG TPA: tetratricopeptide repeat protein [Chitinophagales bacterium]|nr:tetratricopeptide repeat protein [Chitinophagales bacterium]